MVSTTDTFTIFVSIITSALLNLKVILEDQVTSVDFKRNGLYPSKTWKFIFLLPSSKVTLFHQILASTW